jgi:hypothetical protein
MVRLKAMQRPAIGTLVRLKSWNKEAYIKVASHTPDSEDTYSLVPSGATVMVVGYHTRAWDRADIVPVVTVGNVTGWIFMDEWEVLDDTD